MARAHSGRPARSASSIFTAFQKERFDPAFAPLYALIFGRVIQAFGAGAMVRVSMALVADLFPPEKRAFRGELSAPSTRQVSRDIRLRHRLPDPGRIGGHDDRRCPADRPTNDDPRTMSRSPHRGGMAEWSMAVVLKTTVPGRVPGVRIPLPPPSFARLSGELRMASLAPFRRASNGKPCESIQTAKGSRSRSSA